MSFMVIMWVAFILPLINARLSIIIAKPPKEVKKVHATILWYKDILRLQTEDTPVVISIRPFRNSGKITAGIWNFKHRGVSTFVTKLNTFNLLKNRLIMAVSIIIPIIVN